MMQGALKFEKVGDVDSKYPYLCIYNACDDLNPFMEIGVTDDGKIRYAIYPSAKIIELDDDDWRKIRERAIKFLPEALASE
ncbi:MAG: hypothetical protein QM772_04595 [Ottowia sp.]|uniref:hypothetical protein n=1 Tax=Ottowia sp. TaxID=1898956 RepID=UPI0039E63FA4